MSAGKNQNKTGSCMATKTKAETGLHNLRTAFEKLSVLPDSEWNYISGRLAARNYRAEEFLIRAGEPATEFFFIVKGLTRFFYVTPEGKEFNKFFALENELAGSHWYKMNAPCPYSVQAVEDTETIVMPAALIEEAYNRHPSWERIGRLFAERLSLMKELREKEFLLDPAEARYRRFLQEYPDLSRRIPQYHIASYLGITDVALSRIRKKMKK